MAGEFKFGLLHRSNIYEWASGAQSNQSKAVAGSWTRYERVEYKIECVREDLSFLGTYQ
jgi:hypothetical protein